MFLEIMKYIHMVIPKNIGITSSSQLLTAVFLEIKISKGSVQFSRSIVSGSL